MGVGNREYRNNVQDTQIAVKGQIELTQLCNNKCFHCYNFWKGCTSETDANETFSREQITDLIEMLAHHDVFQVTLTGGEPLLFPELVLLTVQSCTSLGIEVSVNSNLTKLDPKLALALRDSGLRTFLTSIAGPSSDVHDAIVGRKGAFAEAVRGIRIAKEHGFRVTTNMVASTLNQELVMETGAFVASLGVDTFAVTKANSPCSNDCFREQFAITRESVQRHLAELIQLKGLFGFEVDVFEHYPHCLIGDLDKYAFFARRRCTAGVTGCTIGPNGQMRPCSHSRHEYGNVFDAQGFNKAWLAMGSWRNGSLIPLECRPCKHLRSCSGGCRVDAELLRGDLASMETYATVEVDVISDLPKHTLPVLPPKMRIFDLGLRFRNESFGICVKRQGREAIFVHAESADLLRLLQTEDYFCIDEVCDRFTIDRDSAIRFFSTTAPVLW